MTFTKNVAGLPVRDVARLYVSYDDSLDMCGRLEPNEVVVVAAFEAFESEGIDFPEQKHWVEFKAALRERLAQEFIKSL